MRRRGTPLIARRCHHRRGCRDCWRSQPPSRQQKYANQNAAVQQQQDMAYQQGVADAQAQQQQVAPPPPQYAPAPPPAPAAAAPDLTAQLQQLAQLHNAGVLSDDEFAAAKQKLLAG